MQAAATPLSSAGLWSKALAAVQSQVCFIQGCKVTAVCKEKVTHKGLQTSQINESVITSVAEGDASICGEE